MKVRPQFLALVLIVGIITIAGLQFNFDRTVAGVNATSGANTATIADVTTFNGALAWVKGAGYLLMFIAMVIEGPIITAAAAFAVALGYFNIFAIFALSVAGDIVGDFIYYGIGYVGRVHFVEKYGHHVGLTERRLKHMEKLIKKHPKKTLTAIKLAPVLPAPGLMMIGAVRMPVTRYAWMTFLVALPKTLLFIILGYFFGSAYDHWSAALQNGQYIILIAVGLTVVAFYGFKKISAAVSNRLERI